MTTTEPAKTTRPGNPPKPPGIDAPRLAKTLDWALEQHRRALAGLFSEWNQISWLTSSADLARDRGMQGEYIESLQAGTACGTACCIAGKVAFDAGWYSPHGDGSASVRHGETGRYGDASAVAAELLGISPTQASLLFSGGNRIEDLYAIAEVLTDGEITAPPELDVSPDLVAYTRERLEGKPQWTQLISSFGPDLVLFDDIEMPTEE